MRQIFPPKLQHGDTVAIVSPSQHIDILSEDTMKRALDRLKDRFQLKVVFAPNTKKSPKGQRYSLSISERVDDLHWAFSQPKVRAIFTVIGGFNSIELVGHLDYGLIGRQPKILCGYSDITVLALAITSKTGLITYSGPHFSTFACDDADGYLAEHVDKCLFRQSPFDVSIAPRWRDDAWFLQPQDTTHYEVNVGPVILNAGRGGCGRVLAGNLPCINYLRGTAFFNPACLAGEVVLLVEWCTESAPSLDLPFFAAHLNALLLTLSKVASRIVAIGFGRFERSSHISCDDLRRLLEESILPSFDGDILRREDCLIVANLDFGHTLPICTLPIMGAAVKLTLPNDATNKLEFTVLEH